MIKIYSLNFYFKKSQILVSIQIYTLGMKFTNLSVNFKLATLLYNKIQTKYSITNMIMIIKEVKLFMELGLISKVIKTKISYN